MHVHIQQVRERQGNQLSRNGFVITLPLFGASLFSLSRLGMGCGLSILMEINTRQDLGCFSELPRVASASYLGTNENEMAF